MPKPISHEQMTDLQNRGVLPVPGVYDVSNTAAASDTTLRVLGNIGLPGTEIVERIDEPNNVETSAGIHNYPIMNSIFTEARIDLQELLLDAPVGLQREDALIVPSAHSPELTRINWGRLNQGYETYIKLGLEPQVVISPEGLALDKWLNFFGNLRSWQEQSHRKRQHSFLKLGDCDGLLVRDDIARYWASIVGLQSSPNGPNPRWEVSVIPGVTSPPVSGVDYNGIDLANTTPSELSKILASLPKPDHARGNIPTHPSVESYLTLQALRLHKDQSPIDDEVGGSHDFTWLGSSILLYADTGYEAASCGRWNWEIGQLEIEWRHKYIGEDMGFRPTVRG